MSSDASVTADWFNPCVISDAARPSIVTLSVLTGTAPADQFAAAFQSVAALFAVVMAVATVCASAGSSLLSVVATVRLNAVPAVSAVSVTWVVLSVAVTPANIESVLAFQAATMSSQVMATVVLVALTLKTWVVSPDWSVSVIMNLSPASIVPPGVTVEICATFVAVPRK
jgi:hypothetical protein